MTGSTGSQWVDKVVEFPSLTHTQLLSKCVSRAVQDSQVTTQFHREDQRTFTSILREKNNTGCSCCSGVPPAGGDRAARLRQTQSTGGHRGKDTKKKTTANRRRETEINTH